MEPEVDPGEVAKVEGDAVGVGTVARRGKRLSQAPYLCRGNTVGVAVAWREPHRAAGAPCIPSPLLHPEHSARGVWL